MKLSASELRDGPALVFGATGYTGRQVVAELCRLGVPTIAHVRPGRPGRDVIVRELEAHGARTSDAAWEPEAIADATLALAPRTVFGLLGTTRARARRDGQGYADVDVGMTMMAIRAAERLPPTRRFVYLSALGVGPRARGPYLRARWEVESALGDSALEHVIVRPSIITGSDREGRSAERMAGAMGDGVLGVLAAVGISGPRRRWGSMTGTELGRAIARISLRESAANTVVKPPDLRQFAGPTEPPESG